MVEEKILQSIEFMLDESKKVTVRASNDSFPLYLLGMVSSNPEYKQGKSLVELIADALSLFITGESLSPTLDSPIRVNIRVHGREKGVEDHTLFGFYRYFISSKISLALFDGEMRELPDDAARMIREGVTEEQMSTEGISEGDDN